MHDIPVDSLSDFSMERMFKSESMRVGLARGGPHIRFKEASWRDGSGPVWDTDFWGGDVTFGFKLRTDGRWNMITSCTLCGERDCWHVFAIGRRVIMSQGMTLDQWQRQAGHRRSVMGYGLSPLRSVPKPPTTEERFDAWMLTRAGSAAAVPRDEAANMGVQATPSSDLIFMVVLSKRASARVSLEAAKSRKLKTKDLMSKAILLSEEYPETRADEYMGDPLYVKYARWCSSNFAGMANRERWSSIIEDSEGVGLLREAAESGRLYLYDQMEDRPVGPVQWGPVRPMKWNWAEKTADAWSVTHEVDGGGAVFFGLCPIYADLKGKTVGPLDLEGMEPASAEVMLTAPPIPKAWLNQNARSPGALRFLPRPPAEVVQRSTRVIQGVVPKAVLTVEVKDRKEIFGLDLSFRYDDVLAYFTAQQHRIQIIRKSEESVEVVRDMDAEASARRAMLFAGLSRAKEGDWRFDGGKELQIDGFRKLLETDFAGLRGAGFEIALVEGWSSRVQQAEAVKGGFDSDEPGLGRTSETAGLEFSMGFYLDGERFNLLPLVGQILEIVGGVEGINRLMAQVRLGQPADTDDAKIWVLDEEGKWIGMPRAALLPWLSLMAELVSGRRSKEMSAPSIVLSRIEALRMEATTQELELGGAGGKIIAELLAAKACRDEVEIEGFTGTLEPFQRTGVHWMRVLGKYQLGGVLGDDRGLGKTVQCIAHLQDTEVRGELLHPALIVAIPTQVRHWEKHLAKLAPGLKVLVLGGAERREHMGSFGGYDAVVTTWAKIALDVEDLRKQHFQVAYLDETERIHNHNTNVAKAVRLLDVGHAIGLNGSPVENSFGDLWSVMDAVLHGFLGTVTLFARMFRAPIEDHQDIEKLRLLRKRIAPFMLRRLKKDSGVSLPPVRHEDVALRIRGQQANLYEVIRITTEAKVQEALAAGGARSKSSNILAILTQLRQVCCDPRLTEIGRNRGVEGSAKLEWISENIRPMVEEGRRILLVCYFTEFFDLIGPVLEDQGIPFSIIRADVKNREAQKEAFKEGRTRVFLLGLKSGGRGTDLPEADTVIHVDPWYNPKAHDQATDRAHRIGQLNSVLNLRLFIEGSFEERVIAIQERKRIFADSLDDESLLDEGKITPDDVKEMLRPLKDLEEDDQDQVA